MTAVCVGDARELAELIRQDPGFKVNVGLDGARSTLLHYACGGNGNRSTVIPLLLAHPDIDVNVKNKYGVTPFLFACANGLPFCVHLLLKDSMVKVNEPDKDGSTPLWNAAAGGHLEVVQWWIASERDMDLGEPRNERTDAIGKAKQNGKTEVVTLLERFKSDAAKTRSEVRLELGINGQYPYYS